MKNIGTITSHISDEILTRLSHCRKKENKTNFSPDHYDKPTNRLWKGSVGTECDPSLGKDFYTENRESGLIYEETRGVLKVFLENYAKFVVTGDFVRCVKLLFVFFYIL